MKLPQTNYDLFLASCYMLLLLAVWKKYGSGNLKLKEKFKRLIYSNIFNQCLKETATICINKRLSSTHISKCVVYMKMNWQMGVGHWVGVHATADVKLVPTNGSRSVYTQHATADVTLGPNKWEWVGVHTTRNSRCYTWSQQMGVGRCTHNTQQQMLHLVPTYGSGSVYTQHATADVTLGPNKWEWVGVHTTCNSRCYTWSQQMGVGRCAHNMQQQMLHLVPTNGSGSVYTQHATADVTLGPQNLNLFVFPF